MPSQFDPHFERIVTLRGQRLSWRKIAAELIANHGLNESADHGNLARWYKREYSHRKALVAEVADALSWTSQLEGMGSYAQLRKHDLPNPSIPQPSQPPAPDDTDDTDEFSMAPRKRKPIRPGTPPPPTT